MKKIQVSLLVFMLGIMNSTQVHTISFSFTKLLTACLAIQTIGAEPKNQSANTPTMTPTVLTRHSQVPVRHSERSEIPTTHQIHRRSLCPSCDAERELVANPVIHDRIRRQMEMERTQSDRTSL